MKIDELSAQLEESYIHRSQLWVDFEKALDEIGDLFFFSSAHLILIDATANPSASEVKPTLELLQDMPAKIERRITNIEKRTKSLDGESPSAARRKMKALLSKLS
jgi:hypothetical protein